MGLSACSFRLGLLAASALTLGLQNADAALAGSSAFRIDKVEKAPTIDGVPGEWPRDLVKLGGAVKGTPSATDLAAKAAITYDDTHFFLAADITDDTFRGGGDGDKVEWIVSINGTKTTVTLTPGNPGKSAAKATAGGQAIKDAKVVEAPKKGGWSIEASIPFAGITGASSTRIGMKGAIFVHDADGSSTVEAIVGTTSSQETLAPILTTSEQSLVDGLVKEKKLGEPSFDLIANVTGNSTKERVLVFGNHMAVVGPAFRSGSEFYWNDMTVSGSTMTVERVESKDFDADGRDEIVIVKKFVKSGQKTKRDVAQVYTFGTGDTAEVVFQHEIGVTNAKGSIKNELTITTDSGKAALVIKPGTAKGLDEKNYDEPTEGSFDSVLLPWGTVDSRTFKWKGKTLTKVAEKTHAAAETKPEEGKTETKPVTGKAPPAETKVDAEKVHALFKKDRKAEGSPKFDLSGDFAEGSEAERAVVYGKDLGVFGPGFKKGTSYVFTTLPFAATSDIKKVSATDVTGDGKKELVVEGVLNAKGPNKEDVARDVTFVYQVSAEGIKRVFAAELKRSIGKQQIIGAISFKMEKKVARIVLSSSKAVGFTKENYPFNQDAGPVGGVEPLLLPWSDTKELKFKWSGTAFSKD